MDLRRAAATAAACAALLLTAAADKPKPTPREPAPPPAAELAPAEVTTAGHCLVSKQVCIDFEGDFADGAAAAACAGAGGTFGEGACPAEDRIGTCFVRVPGSPDRTLTRHYKPADPKAQKVACKKLPHGVWLVK